MPLDRAKLASHEIEMLDKVMGFGFSETDAEIIASAILTKKGCSWVNNEEVSDESLAALRAFIASNNYPLVIERTSVSTRNKYIWDVKIKK